MEKKALGKGLNALIPQRQVGLEDAERVVSIDVDKVTPGKYQPRIEFNKEKLNELVSSIKEKGVVQPVLVRQVGESYELIAGERRLRAIKSLGMKSVPAIIKDVDDIDMLEISLIENIQREGLNAIEEAFAYRRFITDFQFTQDKISQALGKDRSTIANTIRLLGLPKKIQDFILINSITAGHGRALLSLMSEDEQMRVCNLVVKKRLSVRETEKIISRRLKGKKRKTAGQQDPNTREVEDELRRIFGTRVRIMQGKKRGNIQIEYYSKEDLERIINLLTNSIQNS